MAQISKEPSKPAGKPAEKAAPGPSDSAPARQFQVGLTGEGQLVSTEGNIAPPNSISGFFDGLDHARIRFARWDAEEDVLRLTGGKGTVCIFTGRSEYIEKYFETVKDLLGRGFDVAIMDWRGQGRSARPLGNPHKGHITTFDQYHGDLVNFMQDIVLPDCRPPYFALAHSMGGTILLQAASRRQPWFKRMVFTAPMFRLERRWLSTKALRRVAEVVCYAGLDGMFVLGGSEVSLEAKAFSGNPITSDRARFLRNSNILRVAPELGIGSPTFGWVHAAGRAMEEVNHPDFPRQIGTPILMIASGNDRIVSSRAIDLLGRNLRGGGTVTVDGARHEVMMETDTLRELFWAAFDAFVPGTDAPNEVATAS